MVNKAVFFIYFLFLPRAAALGNAVDNFVSMVFNCIVHNAVTNEQSALLI